MALQQPRLVGPNAKYLAQIRESLAFTQAAMASALGMSLRAYSDLENEKAATRDIHILAAERVALREAPLRPDPFSILPRPVAEDVLAIVKTIA